MDLRQLRYFLAVVDHGGVRRAAEALLVAQPSISQVIRGLEKDLNTDLFHRLGRRLVITPAGEALIHPAREALRGVELARAAVEAVDGLQGGRLTVSSTSSQAASPLAPIIGRFLTRHPGVHIAVRGARHRSDVVAALHVGDVELGLIARPTHEARPADLNVHPIEVQRYLCVARDAGDLPQGSGPVRPEELTGARLIVGQPGTGMRRAADIVVSAAEDCQMVVQVEHRKSLLPLVLAGAGTAVVAEAFRTQAEALGLVVRNLDVPEVLSVELLHRPGSLSPAAQAFLNVAKVGSTG